MPKKHSTKKSTSPQRSKRGTRSVLGESIIFNCRIPVTLYDRVETLAVAVAQPVPVIVRAALLEYLERHKATAGTPSGLQIIWADDDPLA